MRMQRLIAMRHTCGWAWDEDATYPYSLVGPMNRVPRDYAKTLWSKTMLPRFVRDTLFLAFDECNHWHFRPGPSRDYVAVKERDKWQGVRLCLVT